MEKARPVSIVVRPVTQVADVAVNKESSHEMGFPLELNEQCSRTVPIRIADRKNKIGSDMGESIFFILIFKIVLIQTG